MVPCCIHITQCVCSLTCKYLEQFVLPHFKSPSTHRIFNNDPLLINNIIQVITLWEPASNHFLCNYCIFNILVLSNTCLLNAFLINREIKTNVTNALKKSFVTPKSRVQVQPFEKGAQTDRPIYSVHGNMTERPTSLQGKAGVSFFLLSNKGILPGNRCEVFTTSQGWVCHTRTSLRK